MDPAVVEELGRLRGRLSDLVASVLATTDGMVIAHDSRDIEPDGVAALSAAHFALARRFAHAVNHGDMRESVVQCERGYITSYAAGPNTILTVITSEGANLAMVHLEARRCVYRLVQVVQVIRDHSPAPQIPASDGSPVPLARRTPMATLFTNVLRR